MAAISLRLPESFLMALLLLDISSKLPLTAFLMSRPTSLAACAASFNSFLSSDNDFLVLPKLVSLSTPNSFKDALKPSLATFAPKNNTAI